MRLDEKHIRQLKRVAVEEAGPDTRLLLFGSRLDGNARGGDVDLLLEVSDAGCQPGSTGRTCCRSCQSRHGGPACGCGSCRPKPEAPAHSRYGHALWCRVVSMQRDDLHARLQFLARVVNRECKHLGTTEKGIFGAPFTTEHAKRLEKDSAFAERVEAFVSRFGRLQDTLGNKLLPAMLQALGEPTGAVVDNLDRAERLGWLASADVWLNVRRLRNQMVHECIEDPTILASALQTGHEHVPMLMEAASAMLAEMEQRGWLSRPEQAG